MTTPNINTPYAIIQDAMVDCGRLAEGDTPNPDQLVTGMRRLRDVMMYLQVNSGLKLWLNVDTPITLVAGTSTYTLGAAGSVVMTRPFRVIQAYWLDPQGIRTPLVPLSWDDYMRLSQVNQSGAINSYFANKQATVLSVFFYLTPDSTAALGTAGLLLQTQAVTPTNLTETMNFPDEWRLALRWGLASDWSSGQPESIMNRCAGMAQVYKEALENWDVEDAPTSFAPDQRSQYGHGSFR